MSDWSELDRQPALDVSPTVETPIDRVPHADFGVNLNVPVASALLQPAPHIPNEIPTLGNTLLFFMLAVTVTLILGFASIAVTQMLPAFRHKDFRTIALDARLTIPSQAVEYLAVLGATVLLFRSLWDRPFWQAIQWNAAAVVKRWLPLLVAGVALGLLNGAASNVLPMPKEAPILNDLMRSTLGAWLMFIFGTTMAPLMEELAFRGFLLPSLIHFFRRITSPKPSLEEFPAPQSANRPSPLIVPISILLASIPFALLHAEQVSGAWAPVLLIGIVSVVLCIIRLWTRSLAASTFVHAIYNFTLFAGMAIASDGFRHLDKLNT